MLKWLAVGLIVISSFIFLMFDKEKKTISLSVPRLIGWLIFFLIFIFFWPAIWRLAIAIVVTYIFIAIFIYSGVWLFWVSRGIRIMYVYSESPVWEDHIKKEVLPKLPPNSIIMNWSKRKTWKRLSLSTIVFHYFGGSKAFNPMAILFPPFRRAKVYRFYDAFKEYKHGKTERLLSMERELFQKLAK